MRFFNVIVLALIPYWLCAQIRVGAALEEQYGPLLKRERIGVVANRASVVQGMNIVDLLVTRHYQVKVVFSPEHGFRASAEAGKELNDTVDAQTGIRVVSLYGRKKKPGSADLREVDIIVFDLQDVGVRFYTYLSTLHYVMEACAESGIPMVLMDRPNPNAYYIDGPVLEQSCSSFVGMHPVPIVYGMTIGEYARMLNGEGWLKDGIKCNLTVIRMEGYDRRHSVILPFPPSPNLPNATSIALYPSLCLFEGTPVSIGRGTDFPFQVYGHPDLPYGAFQFTPAPIPGVSEDPPCRGRACRGEDLRDYYIDHPEDSGTLCLHWLIKAYRDYPDRKDFFNNYFDKLAGSPNLREQIIKGIPPAEIRQSWQPDLEAFKKIRKKYLLYE